MEKNSTSANEPEEEAAKNGRPPNSQAPNGQAPNDQAPSSQAPNRPGSEPLNPTPHPRHPAYDWATDEELAWEEDKLVGYGVEPGPEYFELLARPAGLVDEDRLFIQAMRNMPAHLQTTLPNFRRTARLRRFGNRRRPFL